ncbi:MAG TPA: KpsF/GutQ family sugar-phosphate isomerase [Candidatus Blautia faecipullorum]|nr:KpsF/GutQ family sugar-phosphate isomerase [Candidatus Blautia faecipullorum]
MDKLEEGKRVFRMEIRALEKTLDILDETFVKIVDQITGCRGKVIVTGMGKSGHIAAKLAATFASLGTPSFCLHPGEAMHGDLGMVSEGDVVIAVSYSGESDEILQILPSLKIIGARLISITGNPASSLARASDIAQILPELQEACSLGLAPTSSTTAALCYGDALAVAASIVYGFKDADFGKFHPAGALGKKLILKVSDLMVSGRQNPRVKADETLKNAIIELSRKGMGAVSVVDGDGRLVGIITDGDLRRQLEKGADVYSMRARDIMSERPFTIRREKLAAEALNKMKKENISCLIVEEAGKAAGMIRLQDIIGVGIVG